MDAIRAPVLNDLSLAGLGNSDAVGTALSGAYAPIVAQEMAQRFAAIPMLGQLGNTAASRQLGATGALGDLGAGVLQRLQQNTGMLGQLGNTIGNRLQQNTGMLGQLGSTGYAQQQGNVGAYGQSEAERRAIQETQEQAEQQDMLRRQQLAQQFTTGILGGFPSISGSVTKSKQSGGGMTVICTELYRQGLMDEATFEADQKFGEMMTADII
jgi:hypothetical protein